MSYRTTHWKVVNFIVRRVVAIGGVINGSLMALFALPPLLMTDGTVVVNGEPTFSLLWRILNLVMALFLVGFCVFLYNLPQFPWGQKPQ
jgi:hypothetical protein